jgi:hypothetical protein
MLSKLQRLKFAKGNAKLASDTAIFSLPAGYSCPFARDCLSKAHKLTGKLTDGVGIRFRCYAATAENLFSNIRLGRWRNFDKLVACKSLPETVGLIACSIPRRNTKLVRVHSSGDFFSQAYFDAWMEVARLLPSLTFYAYTKALPFWVARLGHIPHNFKLVASRGGSHDHLINLHKLRNVRVVFSEAQAAKFWRVPIDHDDKLAWCGDSNFALLLHGTQPAGSAAGRILYALRKAGKGGYKANYFDHYKKSGKGKGGK